mgnify:CR=1 FL=1
MDQARKIIKLENKLTYLKKKVQIKKDTKFNGKKGFMERNMNENELSCACVNIIAKKSFFIL